MKQRLLTHLALPELVAPLTRAGRGLKQHAHRRDARLVASPRSPERGAD